MNEKLSKDVSNEGANSDAPRPADSRVDSRPRAEDWFYIWGEIEQIRRATGDLMAVQSSEDLPGARRGGHSLDNSLLIHADVTRTVLRQHGEQGLRMVGLLYVDGWEWEKEIERTSWKDGTTTERETGRYFRKHKEGIVKGWQMRQISSYVKDAAIALGLR